MQIADQRGFSSAPRFGQVREPHRGSRDSRPAGVEDSVECGHYRSTEQQFHHLMEVHAQTGQLRHAENNPGGDRRHEEETQQTEPNRSSPVKSAQSSICIAKSEQGSGNKAHRQKAEKQFHPQRPMSIASCGRICPSLVEEKVRQKKNGLNNRNETD